MTQKIIGGCRMNKSDFIKQRQEEAEKVVKMTENPIIYTTKVEVIDKYYWHKRVGVIGLAVALPALGMSFWAVAVALVVYIWVMF